MRAAANEIEAPALLEIMVAFMIASNTRRSRASEPTAGQCSSDWAFSNGSCSATHVGTPLRSIVLASTFRSLLRSVSTSRRSATIACGRSRRTAQV